MGAEKRGKNEVTPTDKNSSNPGARWSGPDRASGLGPRKEGVKNIEKEDRKS